MTRLIVRPFGRRRRPNPLLALYRWRYEIAVVAAVAGLVRLGQVVHWAVPVAAVVVVALVVAAWPHAFRALQDHVHAVVTQHRLRTAFHELGLTTTAGRGPAILWTSVRPEGLRVRLLCPAGIGVRELAEVREELAAACFASDVRVARHHRRATIVVLTVVTGNAVGGTPSVDEK